MPQLAKLIRAKFPGQYDDMDDTTLEKSVLAKYPDYADLAGNELPATQVKTGYPTGETYNAMKFNPDVDMQAAGYKSATQEFEKPPTPKFEVPGQSYTPSNRPPKLGIGESLKKGALEGIARMNVVGEGEEPIGGQFNIPATSMPSLTHAAAGAYNTLAPLTSLPNLGIMGLTALNPALAPFVGAGFGAQAALEVPNIVKGLGETYNREGFSPDLIQQGVEGLGVGAMALAPAAYGVFGGRGAIRPPAEAMRFSTEPGFGVQPQGLLTTGQRIAGLLPERATPPPIQPNFYQGKAGVADVRFPFKEDITPVIDTQIGPKGEILGPQGESLTNMEMGDVTTMPPIYSAEKYGTKAGADASGFRPTETTNLLDLAQESQLPKPPAKPYPGLNEATTIEQIPGHSYESSFDSAGNLIKVKSGVTGIVQKSSSQTPPNVKSKEVVWRLDPAAAKKAEAVDTVLNPFAAEPPRGPFGKLVEGYRDKLYKDPTYQSLQDWFLTRAGVVLKRVAPDMYQQFYNARAEKANLYGELAGQLEGAVAKLSMQEAANWQQALEGKAIPMNDKVRLAVAASEKITGPEGIIVTLARKYGMNMAKGDEFHAVEKYWPRMPGEGFIKANEALIEKMMKQERLNRHEVINILRGAKKYGPRYGSYLKQRKGVLEGYRTEPSAYFDHVAMSVNDIINTKFFKQGDLSNDTSPLHLWIEKSSDPARAREIAEAYFNRDPSADFGDSKIANAASVWAASTKLQNIILSNLAPQSMTFSRMNAKEFSSALLETLKGAQRNGEIGDSVGVLYHLQKQLASEFGAGSKIVNKGFGLKWSERTNRGFASAVSKATAEAYFEALKTNPGNKLAARELGNLVGEHPDILRKQEALTKNQLNKAAYNGSIMTQGSVGTLDLPLNWSTQRSLPIRLMLLFKKFAANNTGLVMDLAKNNPKAFAKFLPATLLMGEAIGDTKAAIRGTVSGIVGGQDVTDSIGEEIAKRGAYLTPNIPLMGRVIDNFNQGYFGGLVSDLVTSTFSRGKEGLLGFFGGPILSDIGDAAQAGFDINKWRKQLLTRLPIPGQIGRGIEEGLQKREGKR